MKDLNESNKESSKSTRRGFIAGFKEGLHKSSPGFPEKGSIVKRKIDGQIGEVYARDPRKDLLTVRWTEQSGQNTLICNSEQFARDWDLTGSSKSSQIGPIQGVITLLVMAALLIVCIYGCESFFSGPSEYKYPSCVLEHKISVINGKTEYDVKMKLPGVDSGGIDMVYIAGQMKNVAEHEIKQSGSEQSMVFTIAGETIGGYDDYGRAEPSEIINVFDVQYSMDDLKKIDWDHITDYSFLNLGHLTIICPAGAKVVERYCEKHREYSQAFCDITY